MDKAKPWAAGAAAAETVAIFYVACALAVAIFPDAAQSIFTGGAHAFDTGTLQGRADEFADWGTGILSAMLFGFGAGTIYAWSQKVSARHPATPRRPPASRMRMAR